MIRHRKTLPESNVVGTTGELTPAAWKAPHLAFDMIAAIAMPLTLVAANVPVGGTVAAPIEISAGADLCWRSRYDFSFVDFVRLTTVSMAPSSSNARIAAQWSDDEGVTWQWFTSDQQPQIWNGDPRFGGGYNGGSMYSPWVALVAGARRDVLVRFVGWGSVGGELPPNFGALVLWAR